MCNFWRRFLAWTRWSKIAVCEMSVGRGMHDDYHDYPDSVIGAPLHEYEHICKRCGKTFYI
jgi:hypothetical protein